MFAHPVRLHRSHAERATVTRQYTLLERDIAIADLKALKRAAADADGTTKQADAASRRAIEESLALLAQADAILARDRFRRA